MGTISWLPASKSCSDIVPHPLPARQFLPEWYTSICPVNATNFDYDVVNDKPTTSVRNCMPFYDSLTSGYIQQSWCDIFINYDSDNNGKYHYPTLGVDVGVGAPVAPIMQREVTPVGESFTGVRSFEFTWSTMWRPKTPKGWSVLVCHPLNRYDLPFVTTSGIIDSDVFYHAPVGQVPFYVKEGFSGIIPAGTPLFQIIPFKRENWKSIVEKPNTDDPKLAAMIRRLLISSYARQFWQKKRYN